MTDAAMAVENAKRALRRRLYYIRRRVNALRHAGASYDPVFVAGAMGSGTTLLAFLLGRHYAFSGAIPESALQIAPESPLHMMRAREHSGLDDYIRRASEQPHWRVDMAVASMQELYRERARQRSGRILDKAPNTHLLRAHFLGRCFPRSQFVAIFRNPAANIEGFMRKWPMCRDAGLDACIDFYNRMYECFLDFATANPERVYFVEYEDLVANPMARIEHVSEWLGVLPAENVLRFPAREKGPGLGLRNVRDGVVQVLSNTSAESLERLALADRERILARTEAVYRRMRALCRGM